MDLVITTAAGALAGEMLVQVKALVGDLCFGERDADTFKRLQGTLEAMIPMMQEVFNSGTEMSEHRQKQLKDFYEKLQKGQELLSTAGRASFSEGSANAEKIKELERDLADFKDQGWLHVMSLIARLGICRKVIKELCVPESPGFKPIGLESSVNYLKNRLFKDDVRLLGVTGMGGIGKTRLAKALCDDAQVKGHFKRRIFFVRVLQSPNLTELLENMWDAIVEKQRPKFKDDADAHTQLQRALREIESQPTLMVLDDVWKADHLEKLSFEGKGYKTLVTTRNNDVVKQLKPYCIYKKEPLKEPDDVSLFCISAFDQTSIPDTVRDYDLVKEVIKKCGGLPLALEVVGKSLRGQDHIIWLTMMDKISRGQTIYDNDDERQVFKCLAPSIDILKENDRECFLDMVILPGGRKTSVDPLLDLGVYVHELQWISAYASLIQLAGRNLVNLVNNQKDTLGDSYNSSDELSFFQHDALRDFAIYMNEQEPTINRRKRLIMPKKADTFPENWKKAANCAFDAEIVSFHTGLMKEEDWCWMKFPRAKALILNFSANEYFLPPFMNSMSNLKVLTIVNHNSSRAILKGTSVLSSLTELKVVRLERVTVPPLEDYCRSWQKLEKLAFILCKDFGNMEFCRHFPKLQAFTIDHCSNLKELPASICNMTSLKRLSVTNCHDIRKLSDDVGNLSSLQMLRLYACLGLEELPSSICKLEKLEFLDISMCGCIKQLPAKLSQLSNLKEIDMRECSRVRQLPESASGLSSLKHVICDEKIADQWSKIKASNRPRLRVEVAKEDFNLVWLD